MFPNFEEKQHSVAVSLHPRRNHVVIAMLFLEIRTTLLDVVEHVVAAAMKHFYSQTAVARRLSSPSLVLDDTTTNRRCRHRVV